MKCDGCSCHFVITPSPTTSPVVNGSELWPFVMGSRGEQAARGVGLERIEVGLHHLRQRAPV
jgi:hypothetical protein